MEVTKDKYELPVAVADSAKELGALIGLDAATIYSVMYHCKIKGFKCKYIKVDLED
jgi:ribosomal protein L7Ae-like RNA K-turn-binding protein